MIIFLLSYGANPAIMNNYKETAVSATSSHNVWSIFMRAAAAHN